MRLNMEKKKKIITISVIAIVIVLVIGTIAVIVLNQANKKEDKKVIIGELYNQIQENDKYTIETTLDDNNKMYYAKSGNMAYLYSITNGDELKLLVRDGNTYLIKDDEQIYYTYQNNETELSRIAGELEELKNNEPVKGKEKLDNKTYNDDEYNTLTDFAIQDLADENSQDEQNVKTRFYYKNDKLVYIKTIVGNKQELLKVDMSYDANNELFNIPSNYKEG